MIPPDPVHEMRWWHLGLFAVIGLIWRWANKHVQYFKAKINGYTVEKKDGRRS
jgi:hypothetical protein